VDNLRIHCNLTRGKGACGEKGAFKDILVQVWANMNDFSRPPKIDSHACTKRPDKGEGREDQEYLS